MKKKMKVYVFEMKGKVRNMNSNRPECHVLFSPFENYFRQVTYCFVERKREKNEE
jgi:hypothetical protein